MNKFFASIFTSGLLILALTAANLHKKGKEDPSFLIVFSTQEKSVKGTITRWYLANVAKLNWNSKEYQGESMLNLLVANCLPWKSVCSETAEIMIRQGADVNKHSSRQGMTPIHTAVLANNVGAAKFLLSHGADGRRPASEGEAKGLSPIELGNNMQTSPKEVLDYLRETVSPFTTSSP